MPTYVRTYVHTCSVLMAGSVPCLDFVSMFVCVCLSVCPLQVLEIVAEKAELFTPAKRLFTVDGQLVQGLEEVTDKEEYVAAEGSKYAESATYFA